jgi:zinc protease
MKKLRSVIHASLATLAIISTTTLHAEQPAQIPLPKIERKSMLNGMQVLFLDAEGDRCPFLLMIQNGAAFDPVDKWGVTFLMTRMLMDQLAERDYLSEFKARGITVHATTDWDAIFIEGSAPPEEVEFALQTLGEILVRPKFKQEVFDTLRASLVDELEKLEQDPEFESELLFTSRIFQDNPYGHPVRGTVKTVSSLYLRDVLIQSRRLLLPNQTSLALYYSGDRDLLFEKLSRRWGGWVQERALPFTFRQATPPSEPQIALLNRPIDDKCLVRWGYLGVEKSSRDYLTFKVLEQYLTLAMPDWAQEIQNVNHIRGYAQSVARRMPGYLQISIETEPTYAPAYVSKFLSAMDKLRTEPVDEKRFEEAKSLVLQEFLKSLADPVRRVKEILTSELYGLGLGFIPTFPLRLDRVTPEVFQKVVSDQLPDKSFVVVVVSPGEGLDSRLEQFGRVEVLN